MEVAFKLYVEGTNLVSVIFPAQGGSAILRKKWSLDSIGLSTKDSGLDMIDIPYKTYKIKSKKDLERGGLKVRINYDDKRVILYPVTRNRKVLDSKKIVYKFKDLGIDSNQTTDIQKAMTVRKLRAKRDKLPISDKKYTGK